jgi:hypothetical protein
VNVPFLVVENRPTLNALLGHRQVDHDDPLGVGRGRLHRQFQGVQHATSVAVGDVHQMVERLRPQIDFERTVASLRVGQGPQGHLAQALLAERQQLEDVAAADQRPVDGEIRVLSSGTNQDDGAVLHPGQ